MSLANKLFVTHRLVLAKVPLCLLIGYSCFFGSVFAERAVTQSTVACTCAIFLLACCGATFNSLQDVDLDALCSRTNNRPLVVGVVSKYQALIQSVFFFVAATLVFIFWVRDLWLLSLGIIALIFYNGLYTPLKKRTVLSVAPGALAGALPAYIGWLNGGGEGWSYSGGIIILLFVLWQIPHLWLILLTHIQDYQKNSLPSFLNQFFPAQLSLLFITWIGALSCIMILFIPLSYSTNYWGIGSVILNAACLWLFFIYELIFHKKRYKLLFVLLNAALFLHMSLLIVVVLLK